MRGGQGWKKARGRRVKVVEESKMCGRPWRRLKRAVEVPTPSGERVGGGERCVRGGGALCGTCYEGAEEDVLGM